MLPERIKTLLAAGERELAEDRKKQQEELEQQLENHRQNADRNRRKRWGFLCAEAKIDLGPILSEYVDWTMPVDWDDSKEEHWFFIRIPELSEIIAAYRKNNARSYEWHLDSRCVACYQKAGTNVGKFWISFPSQEKSFEYVLALAKESFLKKQQLENSRTVDEIITHPPTITKPRMSMLSQVTIEELPPTLEKASQSDDHLFKTTAQEQIDQLRKGWRGIPPWGA